MGPGESRAQGHPRPHRKFKVILGGRRPWRGQEERGGKKGTEKAGGGEGREGRSDLR